MYLQAKALIIVFRDCSGELSQAGFWFLTISHKR